MTGKKKKHFASEEWVDYVNGAISRQRKSAMQQHLDADCRECFRAFELWQRVSHVAGRESSYEGPESAVRHVRNAFVIAQPPQTQRRLEIPRLVLDSLWRPAVAGVRSASTPRQVIYRAGNIVIEMQLEPVPNTEKINVAGQVSRDEKQGQGLAEILVVVSTPKGSLAEASTNRFGEFQLCFVPEESMRISFGVADGKDLSIPLDGTGVRIFHQK